MAIDNEDREYELLFTVGPMNTEDIEYLLKSMGLSLNDPSMWIGDTGATTHNTAYVCNSINHCSTTMQDNIIGVTGVSKAKTIINIPCNVESNWKKENA
jgi:hypothetical protein